MATLNYTSVQSSNLREIAYDEQEQTLGVRFHRGGEYHYLNVPKPLVEAMLQAPSTGSFFAKNVRGAFETVKLTD